MIVASRLRPEPAIQEWLATWLGHLAAGEANRAAAMLDGPNRYGMTWRAADLESILDETYPPGCGFRQLHPGKLRFTASDLTSGDPRFNISAFHDRSGYSVEHDMPVNRVYSDLTARFDFRWRGDQLAAILHDMLVMQEGTLLLERHESPDGRLVLIVERQREDIQVGFEGMIWHTHADIIACLEANSSTNAALRRFIDDVVNGMKTIALLSKGSASVDAWITDDPARDQEYLGPGEILEFRLWDGTRPPQPEPSV